MIVITGMHRSGTSAVAMMLEALGLDFGDHGAFYGPDDWNELGYFERVDVIDLNSRLLTGFRRTRGGPSALLAQVGYLMFATPHLVERRTRRYAGEIAALAARLDGLAVKDPRFCLTLPAWQEHVSASVACLRHPASVARSLQRRQRVPLSVGLRFWDRHAAALLAAPRETTVYLDFDALVDEDPMVELSRVLDFLGLDASRERALSVFEEQFSHRLRHFATAGSEPLPARTRELWEALQDRRRAPRRSADE